MNVEEQMMDVMIGIVVGLLAIYLVAMVLGLVQYILTSAGLHKLGKRRGVSNAWLAWIPIASSYTMGSVVDEYDGRNGIKRKWRALLLTFDLLFLVVYIGGYVALVFGSVMTTMQNMTGMETMPTMEDISAILMVIAGLYGWLIVLAIVASVQATCKMICLYKIFESTVPKKSIKYLLLSLLVPMAQCICVFRCRNKGYSNEVAEEMVSEEATDVEE